LNPPQLKESSETCLEPRELHKRARENLGPDSTTKERGPSTSTEWDNRAKTGSTTDLKDGQNIRTTPRMPRDGWQTDQSQWTLAEPEPLPIGEEEGISMVEEEEEQMRPKPTKETMLASSVAKSDTLPATALRNAGSKSTS
jgi:hypothetical protein